MKGLVWVFIVIVLIGCTGYTAVFGSVDELGEPQIIRNGTVVVDMGAYPFSLVITGFGEFHAVTTGGVLINSSTSIDIVDPGSYWLIMDTSFMNSGDVGTISVMIVSGEYYDSVGLTEDNYKYYTLNVEVE